MPLWQIDPLVNYASLGGLVIDTQGRAHGMVTHLSWPPPRTPWLVNSGVAPATPVAAIQSALPDLIAGIFTWSRRRQNPVHQRQRSALR